MDGPTDGAEMGKAMVAAGLGISILPDFSITGDPLVRAGVLTTRPIHTDQTTVTLLMLRRGVHHGGRRSGPDAGDGDQYSCTKSVSAAS